MQKAMRNKTLSVKAHARQQWRARIETCDLMNEAAIYRPHARQQWRARIETSKTMTLPGLAHCHARQQWRARIETRIRVNANKDGMSRSPAMAGAD